MSLFDITEGWTAELGPFTLKSNGVVVDLTGMTLQVWIQDSGGNVVQAAGTPRIGPDPTLGQVYFKPAATDFKSGVSHINKLKWKVTDNAGNISFFPNGDGSEVDVYPK